MNAKKKAYAWLPSYPEEIPWDITVSDKPLDSILDETAARFGERPAIDFYGRIHSYHDIATATNACAKGLQKIGIKKGDRVAILMPNMPQYVVAFFAIVKIGAIVVNLNPLYTEHELEELLKDSKPKLVITTDLAMIYNKLKPFLENKLVPAVAVAAFAPTLPCTKHILFRCFKNKETVSINYDAKHIHAFDTLLTHGEDFKRPKIDPKKDVAVLQYTGGTTGTSKGAMLSHYNMVANIEQMKLWFHGLKTGHEKIIAVLPFFHVFAMTVIMGLGVAEGCCLILHLRFQMKQLLKDITKKKPSILPGVPTLFAAINHCSSIHKYDLSSIKSCISGGAPLLADVKKAFEKLSGCSLVEGYGLTEAAPVVSCNPLFGKQKPGSAGIPMPATVIKIYDPESGKEMPQGEIGEICVSAPQVMLGYYKKPEETKDVFRRKELRTGDMGYLDEEGYLFIVDRLKELIIVSGFNVYPREVEEAIADIPSVKEVAVIGEDDAYKGQKIHAFVALKEKKKLTKEALIADLKETLVHYKIPSKVTFMDELPKTMVGKIDKKPLKQKRNA